MFFLITYVTLSKVPKQILQKEYEGSIHDIYTRLSISSYHFKCLIMGSGFIYFHVLIIFPFAICTGVACSIKEQVNTERYGGDCTIL